MNPHPFPLQGHPEPAGRPPPLPAGPGQPMTVTEAWELGRADDCPPLVLELTRRLAERLHAIEPPMPPTAPPAER